MVRIERYVVYLKVCDELSHKTEEVVSERKEV